MVFRDQKLICEECGATFFFTVSQQRRTAERLGTVDVEAPRLCPQCQAKSRPAASDLPKPPETASRPMPESHSAPAPSRERTIDTRSVEEVFPLEEAGIEVKLIGTVKWFSREKGYGFITKADGQDLFFHRADISKDERVWPEEGQKVEFQIRLTEKGPEAFNVSMLPTD
jgi:CspA family cold shock protein